MTRAIRVVALLLAAALGYAAWQRLFPSDEARIHRALDELAAAAGEAPREPVAAAAWAARLGRFFARDVLIEPGPGWPPVRGRDALVGMAAAARPGDGLRVRFVDADVRVDPGREAAAVDTTVTITGAGGDRDATDARELALEFRRVDGDWLIARATAVQPLAR